MQYAVGDAMALGCALAWAIAILLFRRVPGVTSAQLNLFKNVFATVLLLATMLATGRAFDRARTPFDWMLLICSGVLGLAVADTLLFAGLRRVGGAVAAIADCIYAPTVLLLSVWVLGEPVPLGLLVGGPLVIAGLAIVVWEPSAARGNVDLGGVLLVLVGVMVTAVAVVMAKPALERSELLEATTVRLASGALALFVWTLRGKDRGEVLSIFVPQAAWRLAVPATVMGTYISMLLWLGGMKYGTASRAALLNQLSAVFIIVLSHFTGEPVSRRRWFGAAIAICGVMVVLGM